MHLSRTISARRSCLGGGTGWLHRQPPGVAVETVGTFAPLAHGLFWLLQTFFLLLFLAFEKQKKKREKRRSPGKKKKTFFFELHTYLVGVLTLIIGNLKNLKKRGKFFF
jgi:hypothetical protein